MIACLFLPVSCSGYALSFDAWRARARGLALPQRVPVWGLRLMALLVTSVYLLGAVDKCHWPYLSGERLSHHFIANVSGSLVNVDTMLWRWGFALAACASVMLEFALAFGLWFRRTRPTLMALGIVFHFVIYVTMPVATFSATMMVLYLCFLSVDEAEKLLGPPPST